MMINEIFKVLPIACLKRMVSPSYRRNESYVSLKREVAWILCKCFFGKTKRKQMSAEAKERLSNIMRDLDKTFREHGLDWKLNE